MKFVFAILSSLFLTTAAEELSETSLDIEIVGIFDGCGLKSVCDKNSHLVCKEFKCVCDTHFALDHTGNKCVNSTKDDEGWDYDDYVDSPETGLDEDSPVNGTSHEEGDDSNESESEESQEPDSKEAKVDKPEAAAAAAADASKVEDQKEEVPLGRNHNDKDMVGEWNNTEVQPEWNEEPDAKVELPSTTANNCTTQETANCTRLGPYAICINGNCKCHDTEGKNRTIVMSEDATTCVLFKEIGDQCQRDEECDDSIFGPAFCHINPEDATRYCTCRPFHVYDEGQKRCLPIASAGLFSQCTIDEQCSAREALGPFGICSEVTGRCECMISLGLNVRRVVEYGGRCVEARDWGDSCESDQDCEATLGFSSICHPETKKCSCAPGEFCAKSLIGASMSNFTMFVLIVIACSIFIGSVACFLMRRPAKSYSFVRQENDA